MDIPPQTNGDREPDTGVPPFSAPSRRLGWHAPLGWLRLGWHDLRRAPRQSLGYGLAVVALSYLASALAYGLGRYALLFSLLSGFVFIGPLLAIGVYSISCQLARGLRPTIGYCLREGRRHLGNEMVFAVVVLIVFLIWARAASMVHVFFPIESDPDVSDLMIFLGVGCAVGTLFAAVVFSAAAFSLPMIMDRQVDVITAVLTSVNAVLHNKGVMALWGTIIVAATLLGFATAFLGLAVLLPLLGHASWHAYRETIIADAWPAHPVAEDNP